MNGVLPLRSFTINLAAALAVFSSTSSADSPNLSTSAAATRAPDVRFSIQIPKTHGPWQMVLVNHDVVPARVVADARRMTLLIRGPAEAKYKTCKLPSSMQDASRKRQLVLRPGQKYVEPFDPRLYCWGSVSEKLTAGSAVTAFLGWKNDPKRERKNKTQRPPFAAEPVLAPAAFIPQKRLVSITHWLGDDDIVQANPKLKSPQPKYVGAPDLRLSTHRWADATNQRTARLTATLTNVGDRSALVHLRPDDLEIRVRRPDGSISVCGPGPAQRAAVRDFFQTIKPGKKSSVRVLLGELCPSDALQRPGLYELSATLHVRDDGSQFRLQALTGDFKSSRSTLLRVRRSRHSFHQHPPSPHKPHQSDSTPPSSSKKNLK